MGLKLKDSDLSAKEAIGPFRTYNLSRGLTLNYEQSDVVVRGGSASYVNFPMPSERDEFGLLTPSAAAEMLTQVECDVGVKLLGATGHYSNDVMFRVDNSVVSGGSLAEDFLGRLTVLESLLFRIALSSYCLEENGLRAAREMCALIHQMISDGKFGLDDLSNLIDKPNKVGTQAAIEAGFFLLNAQNIAEDIRTSILAACRHFVNVTTKLHSINFTDLGLSVPENRSQQCWERILRSPEVDDVAFLYSSSVIACYTSLDLLYRYFVYLTRVPLLNPEFPKNLHFPDAQGHNVFQSGGEALEEDLSCSTVPFAIPNLKKEQFAALRKNRNDLVHNMAVDAIRPRVYVGSGLPPVNCHQLQYVQYMVRDTDLAGNPVTHPWNRRFYKTRSDGQEVLYDWLEQTWQCIFDTAAWLTHRLKPLANK